LFRNAGFTVDSATRLQLLLSERVIREDHLPDPIKYVAGVDVAYKEGRSIGAVAVFDYDSMRLVEKKTSCQTTPFPYIPTFLSFRELPPAILAIRKLDKKPDVFLVDGHGLAHPRRLGFASHLGLVLDAPTIGVAKSLLCGEVKDCGSDVWKPLVHEGEIVGEALFTRPRSKPLYLSVGHKVSLETAIKIVLHCSRRYRVPVPLREAHITAETEKKHRA